MSDRSKAAAIAAQTSKVISERYKRDEVFYGAFSDRIKKLLEELKNAKNEDIASLFREMKDIQQSVDNYEDNDLPPQIREKKELHSFYRNTWNLFEGKLDKASFITVMEHIVDIIKLHKKVDFENDITVKRSVLIETEDFLLDDIESSLSTSDVQSIAEKYWELAVLNKESF